MNTTHLIVGGGIAGMVAAFRLRQQGEAVTLIEKEPRLGGLLASVQPGGDHWFDYGTHIPAAVGDAELDDVLFGQLDEKEWLKLPVLKSGAFWNGALQTNSPCLDLRTLPPEIYERATAELLQTRVTDVDFIETLEQQLSAVYGSTMLRHVFTPLLRKFFASEPANLATDAHLLFGLSRFICLDPATTRTLKQQPRFDRILAYHGGQDAPLPTRSACAYYPRLGGVGRWVDGLSARLTAAGVHVLTGASLKTLDIPAGQAVLNDGREVRFNQLEWTLPPGMLLKLCGHLGGSSLTPPRLAPILLYHFVGNTAPLTDAYYITCYEPSLRSFRVTLYDNLQPSQVGRSRVTVEVVNPAPEAGEPDPAAIWTELQQMALLPSGAVFSQCHRQRVAAGFPLPTCTQRRESVSARECVEAAWPSVRLLGRAAGQGFFMRDVLLDAWRAQSTRVAAC